MEGIDIIRRDYEVSAELLIRTNLVLYIHMNDIKLSKMDINSLVLLGLMGEPYLVEFCAELVKRRIHLSVPSARNALELCEDKGLIVKKESDTRSRKLVMLSDEVRLPSKKNLLLSINCIYR